jgi:hypothetical protein
MQCKTAALDEKQEPRLTSRDHDVWSIASSIAVTASGPESGGGKCRCLCTALISADLTTPATPTLTANITP